jgi:hypothetical protein
MKWRGISEAEVLSVIEAPDRNEASIRGRINLYKRIGRKHLKVTYREFPQELLVISVVDKGGGQ